MLEENKMFNVVRLINQLKEDEGSVESEQNKHVVYFDSEGYATLGYGRLVDSKLPGSGLTDEEAMYLLRQDVTKSIDELERAFPFYKDLPGICKEAMVNMVFNLGMPRLKKFKKMLAAIEAGDGEQAYVQALDSKWADQVKGRATRIAEIFRENL